MNDSTIYFISLGAFGLFSIYAAYWLFQMNKDNLSEREKIPRSLMLGMPIAIVDLLWCIPHAKPLLPNYCHPYLLPLAIAFAIMTYFFLDYVFARALGGFFILLAYFFLHESFTFHTPVKPLFSLFCYAMGVVGLFYCGKPYLFRDTIRKLCKEEKWRYACSGSTALFAVFSIVLCIYHFSK